jgi:low affinity Fe/Cu permease
MWSIAVSQALLVVVILLLFVLQGIKKRRLKTITAKLLVLAQEN